MRLRVFLCCVVGTSLFSLLMKAHDVSAQHYDLMRGAGVKRAVCLSAMFGPGIKPDDLEVVYVKHNSFKFIIKGTEDSLLCGGFYAPALRDAAQKAKFLFADGAIWTFEDIDKRTNLRALASQVPASQSTGPAPAPSRAFGQFNKCVVDGKVTYTDGDCPTSAAQERTTTSVAPINTTPLPKLQFGLWKLSSNVNGETAISDYCGNPLVKVYFYQSVYGAQETRKLGCAVNTTSSTPGNFRLLVECPADSISEDGSRSVRKGRMELTVDSASELAFAYRHMRTADNFRHSVQGTRIGSCNE